MALKIVCVGLGRMGLESAKKILSQGDFTVVAAFDPAHAGKDLGLLCGIESTGLIIESPDSLGQALKLKKPDVAVDFTLTDVFLKNAPIIASSGVKALVGTTGFSDEQKKHVGELFEGSAVIFAPNLSRGVNAFFKLAEHAAKMLCDYDIEVVEAHHNQKKDAPSGTALKAADIVSKASGKNNIIFGRHGQSLRSRGDVCVHSVRGGDITGEHTIMFITGGERFELRHIAHSRQSFASGIPDAIRYLAENKGVHDMWDVLGIR
jgi:4-hydroxy-tetrahydrodipicolinate reductase